ncbi:MAG: class I SAM-dependent methyltransferase [Acidobacteriota bacterium]
MQDKKNNTVISRKFAEGYDRQSQEYGWVSPEILFGLGHEYLKPGNIMLDVGTGTGLSSLPFHKAGVQIYGIDGSKEMLKICASKNIAIELKKHDLSIIPIPYQDKFFHHITVNGVFHLLSDLAPLMGEISRMVKDEGILSFTYEEEKPDSSDGYFNSGIEGITEKINKESGVRSYRHSFDYINNLLELNQFVILKKLEFLAFRASPWDKEKFFQACIVRKNL